MHAYERILTTLTHEIADGVYQPGTLMPTIPTLMDRFGQGRSAVRQAVDDLIQMGLIHSGYIDGKRGMIVRDRTRIPYFATDGWKARRKKRDCFRHAAEKSGKTPTSDFERKLCVPDLDIRQRLGTADDEVTVARISKQFLNDQPWSMEMSFYPRDIAEKTGVDTPDDIPEGAYLRLEERGYSPTSYVEEIIDSVTDPETSQALSIPLGSPVLIHFLTGATDERVLFVSRWIRLGRQVRMIWETGDEGGLEIINKTRGEIR